MAGVSAVRVRFAPSPTGFMHLGGLRTALYNALFAKRYGGKLVLRIEDTDQKRFVDGAATAMQDALAWCGVVFDEGPHKENSSYGPYIQSQRLPIYHAYTESLIEQDRAYRCFCTSERLDTLRRLAQRTNQMTAYDGACLRLSQADIDAKLAANIPHTLRLRVPKEGHTVVRDEVYGSVEFPNNVIDDQVLVKSNGFPTYHFANVVDDHLMEISHVLRGEEWLSSTAKHLHLYDALGWEPPKFAHLPLLINLEDRSKLSKRQQDLRLEELKHRGILPAALVNFVSFLGWKSPAGQTEIFHDLAEIATVFDLADVSKAPAVVDMRKLAFINKQHLGALIPTSTALEHVLDTFHAQVKQTYASQSDSAEGENPPAVDRLSRAYLSKVVLVSKDSFDTVGGIVACDYFWKAPTYDADDRAKKLRQKLEKQDKLRLLPALHKCLSRLLPHQFNAETIKQHITDASDTIGIRSTKDVMLLLRFCITGTSSGPPIFDVMSTLGSATTLERIQTCIDNKWE
eukprot:m.323524 g.323524  ORF g.323524 m.323524 type:complete len:514 (+) comp20359_c1_seq1:308-1849(+)